VRYSVPSYKVSLRLSPLAYRFAMQLVASGNFPSVSEVLREAMREYMNGFELDFWAKRLDAAGRQASPPRRRKRKETPKDPSVGPIAGLPPAE
jgi:Arc/MetJ-type ribon-helix-helix transcriptional regulator